MASGTVKWFNEQKGYGFIEQEGGGPDAFLHISALVRANLPPPSDGTRLRYELVRGRNGKESAENVELA